MDYEAWVAEQDATVIPFPLGQFERAANERESELDQLAVRTKRDPQPCEHQASFVDEQARRVTCRACGVELDPVHVLAKLAGSREYLVRQGRSLRHEAASLQATVDRLKRDERNAKARLRNAEHPALKEARQALGECEKLLWDARGQLGSASPLEPRLMRAWSRARRAAEALRPANAATL